jgi:hypothetical protein
MGGAMVGDYISASFLDGAAMGIFAAATAPVAGVLHESMQAVQF